MAGAASACVTVTRTLPDGTTERLRGDEIRAYAGNVFRRHNAASSALLEALPYLETQAPHTADALLDDEERMNEACAPVDRVAVAYRDTGSADLGDRIAFARALDACEQATRALEAELEAAGVSVRGEATAAVSFP